MRVVTLELLLNRISATVEQEFTQHLPTTYLRSMAIATASLLSNLAARAEEKSSLLAAANQEMRAILEEARLLLSGVREAAALNRSLKTELAATRPSLSEDNAALRRALYETIQALYRCEGRLDGERLGALRVRIRTHLRRQLDQDLAIYHPVRAGKMFRGG